MSQHLGPNYQMNMIEPRLRKNHKSPVHIVRDSWRLLSAKYRAKRYVVKLHKLD